MHLFIQFILHSKQLLVYLSYEWISADSIGNRFQQSRIRFYLHLYFRPPPGEISISRKTSFLNCDSILRPDGRFEKQLQITCIFMNSLLIKNISIVKDAVQKIYSFFFLFLIFHKNSVFQYQQSTVMDSEKKERKYSNVSTKKKNKSSYVLKINHKQFSQSPLNIQ